MAVEERHGGWVLVVAAAGYGKTTALEADAAYFTAADLLDHGPDGVDLPGARLAVDELCRLPAREQVRLLRTLAGAGPVTLAARRPLGPLAAAALPDPVTERGPADLALDPAQTAVVLQDEHGVVDADLAYVVHDLTAGWPALVHLAGDAVASHHVGRGDLLAALTEPGTGGATWLREQVLAELPAPVARLLDVLVDLDPISEPLCAAVAGADAIDPLWWLHRTGLVVPRLGGAFRLVPVLGAVVAGQRRRPGRAPASRPPARPTTRAAGATTDPLGGAGATTDPLRTAARGASATRDPLRTAARGAGATTDRHRTAAGWYAENGYPLAAARTLRRGGDPAGCGALVEARGDEMLAAGGAAEVVALIETMPAEVRAWKVRLVLGDALRILGDVAGARRVFAPLLDRAGRAGCWSPGLTWRAAMLPYMRADYRAALDLLERADRPAGTPTPDDVLVSAGRASALVQLGAMTEASAYATEALAAATVVGDDRVVAAAHIAAALTAVGVRRDEHLASALAAAERAGDVIQQTRVRVNQAHCLLREARYPQALEVAATALRTAELGGPPGMLVTALHNAGEALTRLGRYDAATLHFERSLRISHRLGLNRAATAVYGLAEIGRQLGRREQARAAFQEAAALARETGELQVLVPALAALARLLVDGETDVAAARAAADEAEEVSPPFMLSRAQVARGWVTLAEGDLALAQQRATDAVRAARAGRQDDALAESLELVAAVSARTNEARAALREAEGIWRRAGALPAADQMLVLLGRVPGADSSQRTAAKAAAGRLLRLGVRSIDDSWLLPAEGAAAPVRVSVLGRFQVLVGGRPVPLPAWRSRQARTLLKILVARRGRPIPRLELCELLWPDDEPQRTAHRLSVLLSVVRTVLDPTRLWPTDHHLRADLAGVSFDITRVTVDVEELLRDAAHGLGLARDGAAERAREVLAEVDAAYHGDAFADEPYEDWADGLRERARSLWLQALRELAELCRRAGDLDQAATCLVRMLVADAFDEHAHRSLVAVLVRAGRHGEARRAFDRWTEAMQSIDAPPPDRSLLRGDAAPQDDRSAPRLARQADSAAVRLVRRADSAAARRA